jgi:putative membrane protein
VLSFGPDTTWNDDERSSTEAEGFFRQVAVIRLVTGDGKLDTPTEKRQAVELRDLLAAERTLLAWIRTGLALMGFGFVVARFGLFLQQLQVVDQGFSARSYGVSLWFGTTLVLLGVIVNLSSAWRHVRLVRQLDRGEPESSRSFTFAVAIALFLALCGLAMAIYLISVRGSTNLRSLDLTVVTSVAFALRTRPN